MGNGSGIIMLLNYGDCFKIQTSVNHRAIVLDRKMQLCCPNERI